MDIPSLIEAAKNHDREAALSLIRYFHYRMDGDCGRNGLEGDDVELLERYCYQAFTQILNGKSADISLGLKKPQGRVKQDNFERNLWIACHVERLHRDGYSVEDARGEAAKVLPVSEGTVKIAYTDALYVVRQLDDNEINTIISSEYYP